MWLDNNFSPPFAYPYIQNCTPPIRPENQELCDTYALNRALLGFGLLITACVCGGICYLKGRMTRISPGTATKEKSNLVAKEII
jgi:hypothetical protein